MDVRLERVVRSLAQQGVDPRAVNVDWVTLRRRQQDRAKDDVKAELVVTALPPRKRSKSAMTIFTRSSSTWPVIVANPPKFSRLV